MKIISDGSYGDEAIFEANKGIVGLGSDEDDEWWPTDGYDGALFKYRSYIGDGVYRDKSQIFAISGHTREEWLALGDAMIARWKAWQRHITSLPDDPSPPTKPS